MQGDPRIERYLSVLERVLKPFPVSDRAEIVTEIKSHILSSLENDPEATLDSILAALGEPETVANRYLMERGFKPSKPPISPIVKWLVIGFLGTVAMLLIFAAFLVQRFTPLLKVDNESEKVVLLGGAIEVDSGTGVTKVTQNSTNNEDPLSEPPSEPVVNVEATYQGSTKIESGHHLDIVFLNGNVQLFPSKDLGFHWRCRAKPPRPVILTPTVLDQRVRFDTSAYPGISCDLFIPRHLQVSLRGNNGRIQIKNPEYNLDVKLLNGWIGFTPAQSVEYRYEFKLVHGQIDPGFKSSNSPNAYSVKAQLTNGKITQTH